MRTRHWRGGFAALCTALLLAATGAAGAQAPPASFAITNARIVTGTGEVIERGTILVRDGLIEAVGARVDLPAGIWQLDAEGLTAYPGLIDALSDLGLPRQLRAPAAGAPGRRPGGGPPGSGGGQQAEYSRGPEDRPATFTWVRAADELELGDPRLERWREAGFTTAVSAPQRGLLPGQAAVIDLGGERANDLVVDSPVAIMARFSKGREFPGYPNSLMGVIAYLKQTILDARHYEQAWHTYETHPQGTPRPEYDRALEALRGAFAEGLPVLFPADRAREIGVTPLLYGGRGAWEVADFIAEARVPVLVDVDWPEPPEDADPEAEEPLSELRYRDRAPTSPAALHAAGARFAFSLAGVDDPREGLDAIRLAVRAGLPADAALHALTLGAAQIFGVADRLGSIEPGKVANILLADGDLFAAGTHVRTTIVDGRPFEEHDAVAEQGEQQDRDAAAGRERPGAGERQERAGRGDSEDGERPDQEQGPYEPVPMVRDRGPIDEGPIFLIRHGTVITVAGDTIEGGDVLVRDGKIAAVGRDLEAPAGARVIDASGKFVTPGIIDAHSHIAAEAINEGSVSVSAMVSIRDVLNPDQVSIYRALAGGVTTANVLHGSANPIGGQNAVIKLRWGADAEGLLFDGAPPGIKFALGENTKRDRNPDRYPASRMGVMDVIRQAFLEAREYRERQRLYEQAVADGRDNAIPPRRNLKLDPLVEILEGRRLVHAHSYRADEILQLLRLAERFGFRVATLQHVLEGYRVADEIAAHGAGASTFSDWWAYKVEAYEAIPYNAALMTERGVVVSINSDSAEEMRHLNQEAAKTMHWGGLSRDQAIRLVTLNPAIQLGIDDRVGSLEPGKDADLVIWSGDPLSVYGVVETTFVDGKIYFDRRHDIELRARLAEERRQLQERQKPAPRRGGPPRGRRPGPVTATTAGARDLPAPAREVQR